MNIEIVGVKEKGNIDKERIVLKTLSDLDIGFFIIFFTEKVGDNEFASGPKQLFWFPNKKINKGDLVVLYSKEGKEAEKLNTNGNTAHFYYANFKTSYFNDENKVLAVIEAADWVAQF